MKKRKKRSTTGVRLISGLTELRDVLKSGRGTKDMNVRVYRLDLGKPETDKQRAARLIKALKTAPDKGIDPQPLSSCGCLQAADLLNRYVINPKRSTHR